MIPDAVEVRLRRKDRGVLEARVRAATTPQRPLKAALTNAGFGKRDPAFIDLFVQNFGRMAARMRW